MDNGSNSALIKRDDTIVAYTDGGSRGNPGPAALGIWVMGKGYGEYLGITTNNVAEYKAVIFALRKIKQLVGKGKTKNIDVEIRADSELMVKQMTRQYKVEHPDMRELFMDIWNLTLDFRSVRFVHVPREQNKDADRMVNKALDEAGS
jgi:ribonuclease HI